MVAAKHWNLPGGSTRGISDGAVWLSYFKDTTVLGDLRHSDIFGNFRLQKKDYS